MSTRCLTVIKDELDREIAILYRQSDGYPEGHGKELRTFLAEKRMVNGIGPDATADNAFNGAYDMAARIVSHFKGNEIGGFYLYPAGTRDMGEDYVYYVRPDGDRVSVETLRQ